MRCIRSVNRICPEPGALATISQCRSNPSSRNHVGRRGNHADPRLTKVVLVGGGCCARVASPNGYCALAHVAGACYCVPMAPLRTQITIYLLTSSIVGCIGRLDFGDEHGGSSATGTHDDVDDASVDDTSADSLADEADGSGFVSPTDLPIGCDVLLQDCPRGSKCVPDADFHHSCAPILGDGEMGVPCTLNWDVPATDNCGAGLFCWDLGCTPLCEGSSEDLMCPTGLVCPIGDQFMGLCAAVSCNPLQPNCPFNWPCIGLSTDALCVFSEGAGHGSVPVGGNCEPFAVASSCISSATCVSSSMLPGCPTEGCCTGWCDPLDPQACDDQPGTVCVTTVDEAYGACGLP